MQNATNALVNTGTKNPLVVAGQMQKSFQDAVRFDSEATLLAAKRELEQDLQAQLTLGTSRFSDLVQGIKTQLTILNRNLGLAS